MAQAWFSNKQKGYGSHLFTKCQKALSVPNIEPSFYRYYVDVSK